MKKYKNLSKKSMIVGYEIGDNYVILKFKDRECEFYKYTLSSSGKENIEFMKHLAAQGRDLNAFVDINIQIKYESMW